MKIHHVAITNWYTKFWQRVQQQSDEPLIEHSKACRAGLPARPHRRRRSLWEFSFMPTPAITKAKLNPHLFRKAMQAQRNFKRASRGGSGFYLSKGYNRRRSIYWAGQFLKWSCLLVERE